MPQDESQEAVHQGRERLRVVLMSIGDAVITTDMDGHISFMNPVAESLTGWSNAEAAGLALLVSVGLIASFWFFWVHTPW